MLDRRAQTFDLVPLWTQQESTQISPRSCSYTISANGQYIKLNTLVKAIAALTDRIAFIPVLVIRDIILQRDIGDGVHALPGECQFKELVFENVQYCFTCEFALGRPSEPRELDGKWQVLSTLCERAERIHMKNRRVERVVERAEWQGWSGIF